MNARTACLTLAVLAGIPVAGGAQQGGGDAGTALQVGDRILLQIEGDSTLTDTFTVSAGPALSLPGIGAVALAGVRRADLEAYLTRELARYLKNPVVHAHVLLRLSIAGEVEHPGFYAVPSDLVLADALMRAGGPTRDAVITKLRIERDRARIWEGESLQRAIAQGRTIDQLGLRAGDRVVIPRAHNSETTVRILAALVTIPAAVFAITRMR
jgi:protein involved in polysaccharide export with SLBB domain